jgi:hypothetical protein
MAHISSIGAGMYSNLAVHFGATASTNVALPATPDAYASWDQFFTTADASAAGATKYTLIENVREFPSMGTPPNIVNVPVYGQAQSQQIQGQSDAPSMELTINYVPDDWASGSLLGNSVGDGVMHAFRFTLLNSEPGANTGSMAGDPAVMTVQNSQYFWMGKIEAMLVNPQLTDANTATLTLSIQSDFYGPFTTTP